LTARIALRPGIVSPENIDTRKYRPRVKSCAPAFMLAEDEKIKDHSILSQIAGH
jgi:hypothetical protein